MLKKHTLLDLVESLKKDKQFNEQIVAWKTIPEKDAKVAPFPDRLHFSLAQALNRRGVNELYTHQLSAYQLAEQGNNFVAVTPTASGKTLCYNLPVLQAITTNEKTRALYLYPTKALAQDQKSELNELISEMGVNIKSDTYDGDTPSQVRQVIRKAGHVVMTNPDMLHSAILPHHTKWVSFFENLKFVVIDELHIYRGVFGSHVANVLRRLKRICQFYGSSPTFICTSATIANPKQLAEALLGEKVELVDNNGAPAGKKHIALYNPPIVNKPLNIRKSATLEARNIATNLLKNDIQTIVFARSRVRVEVLLHYLQELVKKQFGPKSIRGYRGGYLPKERREIEKGLRDGSIKGVVSTNALELGVDIGQLQACVLTGYPGSIASLWQQSGRAGRRQEESLVILVASSNPLDQYLMQHPEYIFEHNPESARIQPNNLIILVDHLKCASYELPFREGETFDGVEITEVLDFLTNEQVLHKQRDKWFWMNDSFPAHNISLRSAAQENVVIIDQSDVANVQVIGEMDRFSAMTLLHEEAIYLHQGTQFQVERLDYEEKKAFVREVDVDYYTDANLAVQLKVLEIDKKKEETYASFGYGDVMVNAMATLFKKIKFDTHENIGSGPIHLPEEELHTTATWVSISNKWIQSFGEDKVELGLIALANIFRHVASLHVMCDTRDLFVAPQVKAVHNEKPTIFIYDRYPGGIGLSDQLFKNFTFIIDEAARVINRCPCKTGCPSCIGTPDQSEASGKEMALKLIQIIKGEGVHLVS